MKKPGSYIVVVACSSSFFDGQILLEPLRAHLLFSWGPCFFLRERELKERWCKWAKKKEWLNRHKMELSHECSNATFRIAPTETKLLVSKCTSVNATKTKRECHIWNSAHRNQAACHISNSAGANATETKQQCHISKSASANAKKMVRMTKKWCEWQKNQAARPTSTT